jgi:hypothetical protein
VSREDTGDTAEVKQKMMMSPLHERAVENSLKIRAFTLSAYGGGSVCVGCIGAGFLLRLKSVTK